MRYTAYLSITGTPFRQTLSRISSQARLALAEAFAQQLQQGRATLAPPKNGDEFIDVQQISFIRNEAAALFLIEHKNGCLLHVLAQSGYITGLTNSADLEMFNNLRVRLSRYDCGWEPESAGLTIDPPAYLSVLELPRIDDKGEGASVLHHLFPLAEALAIGFFFSIRLDGPDAYQWEDPDQIDLEP